jgi:hypothetical protein
MRSGRFQEQFDVGDTRAHRPGGAVAEGDTRPSLIRR